MEYTVQLKEDQHIVFATARGEWDSKVDNAMVHEIMEMVDTSGSRKVLLDMRELHFDMPIIQIFERAQEMREKRRQFGTSSTRAALVYSPTDEKIDESLTFFETAARNRGLPYRAFIDLNIALVWLLSEG